ncbi:hypothetical protein A6A06_28160 [Streptomyces sp. CB02923]|uniref:hypothetical protein n=1 Tax=Streptomyces sp. CB02923 TaxID=1718985 RepID=UPI00093C6D0F|nr:hypothetical protein [Streptomyces sp. CB02923]OKH98100.1 hypothetical protein A6A06_28160 [Streptomyces sp. CB02923]
MSVTRNDLSGTVHGNAAIQANSVSLGGERAVRRRIWMAPQPTRVPVEHIAVVEQLRTYWGAAVAGRARTSTW